MARFLKKLQRPLAAGAPLIVTAQRCSSGAFRELEHRNWEKAVLAYDKGWGSVTSQCIPELLAAVNCRPSAQLLDVATGPGFAAQAAAERGADVVAVDFSAKMLELARERMAAAGHNVRLVEADATNMPFDDESFDAIVCAFGVLHLAIPEDFFKEAYRVLRPGGSLAFTVWAPPPATEAFDLILGTVKEHGNPDVPLPSGPPFFQFADENVAAAALSSVGFAEVASRLVAQVWEVAAPSDVFVAFRDGTGRTAALLAGQTESQIRSVEMALVRSLETRQKAGNGKLQLQMPCVLTSATKPAAHKSNL